MQIEHWILNTNSRHQLFFVNSLGGEKYSFVKQQYKRMVPEFLLSQPSIYLFDTIYAGFHLFKFRQEEFAGVHDANVHSFIIKFW